MTPCIWFWIAAIVIFIIAEAVTVALVSVWFIGGAVCALLAAIFGAPGLAQAAVFVIVSALLLILVSRHGTGGTSSVAGDVLCVISAVSYATYLTAFRNVIVKYSPVTTMKWMFLFAAVAAVAIYYRPLAEVDYAALAPRTWAGIGYVVVCSTFLSYFMVPVGQRYLRPTVVSMYNYVQPLVAVLFTVAVGLDTFGFTKGVAALCVFAGVWLVTKSKSRAQLDAERAAAEQAPENRPRA